MLCYPSGVRKLSSLNMSPSRRRCMGVVDSLGSGRARADNIGGGVLKFQPSGGALLTDRGPRLTVSFQGFPHRIHTCIISSRAQSKLTHPCSRIIVIRIRARAKASSRIRVNAAKMRFKLTHTKKGGLAIVLHPGVWCSSRTSMTCLRNCHER